MSDKNLTHSAYGLTVSAVEQKTVYEVNLGVYDQLSKRAAQLKAMLSCTTGDHGEAFRGMADELQENFMWLAKDLAFEIELLTWLATDKARAEKNIDLRAVA